MTDGLVPPLGPIDSMRVAAPVVGRPRALDGDALAKAVELRGRGRSYREIARELGVNRMTVSRSLRRLDAEQVLSEAAPEAEVVVEVQVVESTEPAESTAASAPTRVWPPPVDDATVWRTVPLRDGWALVRRVRLWGKLVDVDAQGRVWCQGCLEMLTTAQLLEPSSGHRASPEAVVRRRGQVVEITDFTVDAHAPESEIDRLFRNGWS